MTQGEMLNLEVGDHIEICGVDVEVIDMPKSLSGGDVVVRWAESNTRTLSRFMAGQLTMVCR